MYDVIIVGGGPAGLTAGIYAQRAGLHALLIEKEFIGGQAATTDLLMNYPGFPDGIGGPELMMQFEAQATKLGLRIEYALPESIDLLSEYKRVLLHGKPVEAKTMILAMGASRRPLGLSNERTLLGQGLSYCATCDGAFYAGKRVAVIGGGNSAVEDALYLAQRSDVLLIHRREQLRAGGTEADTLLKHPRIQPSWNSVVRSVEKQGSTLIISIEDVYSGAIRNECVAALFVAIGTIPNTSILNGQLALDAEGYIPATEDTLTSIPAVFAAGDIRKKPLRQVATAVSDGAVAAAMATRLLMGS